MMDQNKLLEFLGLWLAATIVLLVGEVIFKENIVLGTSSISKPMAAIFSSVIITAIGYAVPKIIEKLNFKVKDEKIWAAVYFVANGVFIWAVKTLANFTGLGVSNNLFVLLLSLGVTAAQVGTLRVIAANIKKK